MRESNPDAQTYAWNWFALHSGQRMQLVNFWLVAIAFLGAAFVQARTSNLTAVAAGVSAIGAMASAAFAMLDARTRNLVRIGEVALQNLEEKRTSEGEDRELQLVAASHTARPSPLLSYRFIIQGLQIFVGVVFTAAFVLTIAVR